MAQSLRGFLSLSKFFQGFGFTLISLSFAHSRRTQWLCFFWVLLSIVILGVTEYSCFLLRDFSSPSKFSAQQAHNGVLCLLEIMFIATGTRFGTKCIFIILGVYCFPLILLGVVLLFLCFFSFLFLRFFITECPAGASQQTSHYVHYVQGQ